jgi:hypothetical protein
MKHFSLAEWADFAREVVEGGRRELMQAHLDDGCKQCGETLKTWTQVHQAALRDRSYEPPEAATRMAKSLLPLHWKAAKPSIAHLLFDSFQKPMIGGVRSASTTARQMLYGVGTYRIDLRMEPQMDSDKVSLVGQVLNSADPVKAGAQVTVMLLRGNKVLGESQTNALGEFHLECSLEGQLQLVLELPRARGVKIPLLVPSAPTVTGRLEVTDSKLFTDEHSNKDIRTRKKG